MKCYKPAYSVQVTSYTYERCEHSGLSVKMLSVIGVPRSLPLIGLIKVTVAIKRLSQNFNIADVRSGQFCDLFIISPWEAIGRRH